MPKFTTTREIVDAGDAVMAISIEYTKDRLPLTLSLPHADALYHALRQWRAQRSKRKGRYRLKGKVCEVMTCHAQIDDRSKRCYEHRFAK